MALSRLTKAVDGLLPGQEGISISWEPDADGLRHGGKADRRRRRATYIFFPVAKGLRACPASLAQLCHASLSRLLHESKRRVVAVSIPLVWLGTHSVLVDHVVDKCTHLATDCVLARSAAGGEVVKVRMLLHLLQCGKLRFI